MRWCPTPPQIPVSRRYWSSTCLAAASCMEGLVAAGMAMLHSPLVSGRGQRAEAAGALFSFPGVPVSKEDTVVVPPGYTAEVLYAWGDPIADGPAFKADASNTTAEQAQQAGMHHDGLQFFPLPLGSQNSTRGLLAINHEYTDDGLLHIGGMEPWTADKVAKSQAAQIGRAHV